MDSRHPRSAAGAHSAISRDGRGAEAIVNALVEDLKRRGLPDPLLAITDGAPGLIRAVETCFPRALRQRCLVHQLRNLRSKAPETQWPEIAIRARACYEAASPATSVRLYEAPNPRLKHPRDAPLGIQLLVRCTNCNRHLVPSRQPMD